MGISINLSRRGAVYYWRCRIPSALATRIGLSHLKMSMKTREPDEARFLAAQLNATARQVFMEDTKHISRSQLEELFRKSFLKHQEKLDLLADSQRMSGTMSSSDARQMDRAMGHAYKIFSQYGQKASIDERIVANLANEGLSRTEIEQVAATMMDMQTNGLNKPSIANIRNLLNSIGAIPSATNFIKAQPIYLRALGEALLQTESRYDRDKLNFDELIEEALSNKVPTPHEAEHEPVSNSGEIEPAPNPEIQSAPLPSLEAVSHVEDSIDTIGQMLVEKKRDDESWTDKTCRQASSLYDLFSRFMTETFGFNSLASLEQQHLSAFDRFLRKLHRDYGRSPKDKTRTIAELLELSAEKPADRQGLDGVTRNRHMTNLNSLIAHAKAEGIVMNERLSTSGLRARKTRTAREERSIPPTGDVARLFEVPLFNGCASWDQPLNEGPFVFHRATYFCTLLSVYTGMRREEYCGLSVADVIVNNGEYPYIHVAPNAFRRIKNRQSRRNLYLHPEIIRLGFLSYLKAINQLGYDRLFPDLYSPSTSSPLGDRYYDEMLPILRDANVTPHQVRHHFGNALKQKKVDAEIRADFLGHGGKSETTSRYCDPASMELQKEHILKLPVITKDLEPHPIRLLPWVEEKMSAPWSKAVKQAKRRR